MTKQDLENWLITKGYSKDKYGHYIKEVYNKGVNQLTGKYRYKLSATSARFEKQAVIVDHNEWLRIGSNYYKNLSINQDGKLSGLK